MLRTFKIRQIPVLPGDVFGTSFPVLVEAIDATQTRAYVRNVHTKRRSTIQIRRLQRDYPRCGEVETARVRREIARWEKEQSR